MKKNKFIKSTLILLIGGFITKILGMLIKIVMTRMVGTEGIGLYMLVNPTFVLLIAICTLGMPTAISKLVSEDKRNNKKLIFSAIPITILIDILVMILIFIFAKFISCNLLHEPRAYFPILSIGFVLPFISISCILRGYFFGKQRMFPHVLSNIMEDVTRLISIMHVNNETGAINDLDAISKLKKELCPRAVFHCDGCCAGAGIPDCVQEGVLP